MRGAGTATGGGDGGVCAAAVGSCTAGAGFDAGVLEGGNDFATCSGAAAFLGIAEGFGMEECFGCETGSGLIGAGSCTTGATGAAAAGAAGASLAAVGAAATGGSAGLRIAKNATPPAKAAPNTNVNTGFIAPLL